jgi:hypothetical protein
MAVFPPVERVVLLNFIDHPAITAYVGAEGGFPYV